MRKVSTHSVSGGVWGALRRIAGKERTSNMSASPEGPHTSSAPSLMSASLWRSVFAAGILLGLAALLAWALLPGTLLAEAEEEVLVSSLGEQGGSTAAVGGSGNRAVAQKFWVPRVRDYTLTEVTLNFSSSAGGVSVAVHEVDGRNPAASSLYELTAPENTGSGNRTFTAPEDATLTEGTSYFVVVTASSRRTLAMTTSNDQTGIAGWNVADTSRLHTADGSWGDSHFVVRMQLKGTAHPSTHSTLTRLRLKNDDGDSVDITPNFWEETTEYTASVGGGVDEITLNATPRDDRGTVEYLDGDDNTIEDAATSTDGMQVSLDDVTSIIKVKVTAEATSTPSTIYTVAVTRNVSAQTLVSTLLQPSAIINGLSGTDRRHEIAQKFRVPQGDDYRLTAMKVRVDTAQVNIDVAIHAANGNKLYDLERDGGNLNKAFKAPEASVLKANTSYSVVISGLRSNRHLEMTTSSNQTGLNGWTVDNSSLIRNSGSWSSFGRVAKMTLTGKRGLSADATLSDIAFTDDDGDDIAFTDSDSDDVSTTPSNFNAQTSHYTAVVDGDTETVTVTATTSHPTAKVEYIDGEGDEIEDAATSTDGMQIALARGRNTIGARVSASNTDVTLTYTFVVERASPATGRPTISGRPVVGQTLTSDTSGISDDDGLTNVTYSYQWLRGADRIAIPGATNSTYTLQAADRGHRIRVRVTFTDDTGSEESLTSQHTHNVMQSTGRTTAPLLEAATVKDTRLVLTYDVALATFSLPDTGAFTLETDGSATTTVSSLAIRGNRVVLTLSESVSFGEELRINYTVPEAGSLQDADGNKAEALVDTLVANQTPGTLVANKNGSPGNYSSPAHYTALVGTSLVYYTHSQAQQFTTGGSQAGYTLDSIEAGLGIRGSTGVPKLTIFSDSSGEPGTELYTLTNPTNIGWGTNSRAEYNRFTAPDGAVLAPNTSYWVVFETDTYDTTTTNWFLTWATNSGDEDSASAADWTIGDNRSIKFTESGAWEPHASVHRITVQGSVIPLPDTSLAAIDITAGNGHPTFLEPDFRYQTTHYSVYATNSTTEVTLSGTAGDSEATVDYLDGQGHALTDANDTEDGMQMALGVGHVTFQIRVTAPDGVRSGTYTIVLTKLAQPGVVVSNFDVRSENHRTARSRHAQAFKTGAHPTGYLLSQVEFNQNSDSQDVLVRVASRRADQLIPDLSDPDTVITLSNPETINANTLNRWTAPEGTFLKPNQTYYIVITNAAGTGPAPGQIEQTVDRDDDESRAPGWSVADHRLSIPGGGHSWHLVTANVLKVQVFGTIIASNDTTLAGLDMLDNEDNPIGLTPQFSRTRKNYTANIANEVDQVTFNATARHPSATVKYLTGSHVLTDADDTKEHMQVDVPGESLLVRILVTAENGHDEKIYVVQIRREENANSPATGSPTITGTARVGQTLTADTSGISDDDGLTNVTYSYQWLRDDTEISGATGSTYTLVASDADNTIKVKVTFTDDDGNEESLTSEATDSVGQAGGL